MPRSSRSKVKVTLITKGRRRYGGIYELPSGKKVYLAYRRLDEIFRSGKSTISEAVRDGVACWAIDEEHIQRMRIQGVPYIGVLVKDTGDIYLTHLAKYLDPAKKRHHNYEARGGSLQRLLPLAEFRVRMGRSKL